MTVRKYWAWETSATLRLLGVARSAGVPTGAAEGRGHIDCVVLIRSNDKAVICARMSCFTDRVIVGLLSPVCCDII